LDDQDRFGQSLPDSEHAEVDDAKEVQANFPFSLI
jgi:hypothetical protein